MLIEQTLDKLHAMKLGAMAEAVQHQLRAGEAATLSFEERLGLLIPGLRKHFPHRAPKAEAAVPDGQLGIDREPAGPAHQCRS